MNAFELVKKHEGVRLKLYRDSTGHNTIGYGRNLDIKGINLFEAGVLLANDVNEVQARLERLSWFLCLDPARQAVMVDMAYNIGFAGLLEFTLMIQALMDKDWNGAATAMLDSKWAIQVGTRASEDAEIIRSGQ